MLRRLAEARRVAAEYSPRWRVEALRSHAYCLLECVRVGECGTIDNDCLLFLTRSPWSLSFAIEYKDPVAANSFGFYKKGMQYFVNAKLVYFTTWFWKYF